MKKIKKVLVDFLQNTFFVKRTKVYVLLFSGMAIFSLAGCGSSDDNDDDTEEGTSSTYLLSSGSTVSLSGKTYASTTADESAVKVTSGTLTLTDCTVTKSGDASSSDDSNFYGLNAAVLSYGSSSVINMTGGTITTSGYGANAFYSYAGTATISDVTINCSANSSRALFATGGGTITASDITATTAGTNSSVIATDRGGGTVAVTGGTYKCTGDDSAIMYSTGTITASGITGTSAAGEIAVVEGSNSVVVTGSGTSLTSGSSNRGIMVLQSGSGDAEGTTGAFSMTGGSLTTTNSSAPLIEVVTNATGNLTLSGVTTSIASGILMKVNYNTQWTTSGATGNLTLSGSTTYTGNIVADSYSIATLIVASGTTWSGMFDNADTAKSSTITLNGGTWNLTGNSNVGTIVLTNGATINKGGYTLSYTTLTNTSGTIND